MPDKALIKRLEAMLLGHDAPLSLQQMQAACPPPQPDTASLQTALAALARQCSEHRAITLCEVASGWRMQIKPDYMDSLIRLREPEPPKLSRAGWEILTIIACQQPVTRAEIEAIRGVAVSGKVLDNLLNYEWICRLGRKEVPGRPMLYGTTTVFLDDLGIQSLEQLPSVKPG